MAIKRTKLPDDDHDVEYVPGGERGERYEAVPREEPKKNAPREKAHFTERGTERTAAHADDHNVPRIRTRRWSSTVNNDPYDIPKEEIPEGLTYEWKRWMNAGYHDPFYIAQMREQGWEPVPPKRHPNWVPPGYNEPHIIKGGMILMDRPEELTEEALREIRQLSKRQIKEAEQRLGKTDAGGAERIKPTVVKEMMRPMVVEE